MHLSADQPDCHAAAATAPQDRAFDGVICFGGEDWWYHNRGHFDIQMMREFSSRLPVLYVNSIGMRTPAVREGRMFACRIARKFRSMTRGLHRIDDSRAVLSPLVAPAGLGHVLTRPLLAPQVRAAAKALNITQPLLWIACPTAATVIDRWGRAPLVYQRTDQYEHFHGVDRERIRRFDRYLKARADLTVFCSPTLIAREADQCRRALLVGHGVDLARFASAGDGAVPEPADLRELPRPRAGFIGGIDSHTFDPDLFNAVVARLPDIHFVLVGACSLPCGWCSAPNVTQLGRKPFEQVDAYMAGCNVLLMPWARNEWIEACNPVKLKEYLAVGRPIVSTPFGALQRYADVVHIAEAADDFAGAMRGALVEPDNAESQRCRVAGESWSSKAALVLRRLASSGICPVATASKGEQEALSVPLDRTTAGFPRRDSLVELKPDAPHCTESRTRRAVTSLSQTASRRRDVCHVAGADLPSLSACVLLSGGMAPSPLVAAAGRTILDWWINDRQTVLDCWLERLRDLLDQQQRPVPVRIICSAAVPPPWPRDSHGIEITYELEPRAFRGTAGLLRDLCRSYPPQSHMLVLEAARFASFGFDDLWRRHVRSGVDISVGCNRDGTPAGMFIIRCDALDDVAPLGFVDFKEQYLTEASRRGWIIGRQTIAGPGALPLWTRQQFLAAAARASGAGPFTARTGVLGAGADSGVRVVCLGASVDPRATLVDSVVMPGATIEAAACVVRSVICPGSRIQSGADIADCVVSTRGAISDGGDVIVPDRSASTTLRHGWLAGRKPDSVVQAAP